jgi:hypothetical protein
MLGTRTVGPLGVAASGTYLSYTAEAIRSSPHLEPQAKREDDHMRSIFTTATAGVIAGVGLLTSDASPINAAVFSVGPPENVLNLVCMNVRYNSTAAGTPVIAYDCHAGPEQQFDSPDPIA